MTGWARTARRAGSAAIAGLLLVLVAPADAITRRQADAVALRALSPQRQAGPTVLFRLPQPLAAREGIWEAGPPTGRTSVARRIRGARNRTWLYWLDLRAGARFLHPSVLLLVDDRTGRVVRRDPMSWWPLVRGRRPAFLRSAAAYRSARFRVYADDRVRPRRRARTAQVEPPPRPPGAPDLSRDCIVTIGDRVDPGMTGDFRAMRDLARGLGVRLQEAADVADLETEVAALERASTPCIDVWIYVTGHGAPAIGSNYTDPTTGERIPESEEPEVTVKTRSSFKRLALSYEITTTPEVLKASDLVALFKRHPALRFKLTVDACFSGRFRELIGEQQLRIVLTSSRADQISFGPSAPGTYRRATQRNGRIEDSEEQIDNETSNPHGASGFTNGVTHAIEDWAADRAARAEGEDLALALSSATRTQARQNFAEQQGIQETVFADLARERRDAGPAPPPATPPPALAFGLSVDGSFRHIAPGESEVCFAIQTAPARPDAEVRLTVSGPGVVAQPGPARTDAQGFVRVRVKITSAGRYEARADATARDGGTARGEGSVTVGDPEQGQGGCPPP